MPNRIHEFIATHRLRFETQDNNKFSFSFSSIIRYYQFLLIILERYKKISSEYLQNTQQFQKSVAGKNGTLDEEQAKLLEEGGILGNYLHLEIESFYLFAKILLDRVARALEFYFGPVRNLALDSHDDFAKRIVKYCSEKKLKLPDNFITKINELKKEISDFRDYEIAHEKSPRTMRGTTYNLEGKTRLMLNVIYPTEKELDSKKYQRESAAIDDLIKKIDEYLESFLKFVEDNQDKSILTPEPK